MWKKEREKKKRETLVKVECLWSMQQAPSELEGRLNPTHAPHNQNGELTRMKVQKVKAYRVGLCEFRCRRMVADNSAAVA